MLRPTPDQLGRIGWLWLALVGAMSSLFVPVSRVGRIKRSGGKVENGFLDSRVVFSCALKPKAENPCLHFPAQAWGESPLSPTCALFLFLFLFFHPQPFALSSLFAFSIACVPIPALSAVLSLGRVI
ncbi:hypothetical protein V8C37DRAFT_376549 [Trichoderma ceciliae]